MSNFTLSPIWGAGAQIFDNNGAPLANGKIYTYYAGTSTPLVTYTDALGNVANTNPIITDSAGRLQNEIWLPVSGAYKFVLKDASDVLIATYDNIPSNPQPPIVNDAASISYETGDIVNAGSFTVGAMYRITSVGTTDFVAIGASGNYVGILFTATGVGSGNGTAEYVLTVEQKINDIDTKLTELLSVADYGTPSGIGTITLNVPADYGTIQAALDFLKNKRIVTGTTVEIKVANGSYSCNAFYLNHPDGELISIVGNETTPSFCVLNFSTSDGFYVPPGYALGKLNGFRIVNTTTKSSATPYLGILTDGGSYLQVGPNIEVHNFYYGIAARGKGFINAGGNSTNYVKVTNAGDVGIWSFLNSYVNCEYAEVSGTDDSANGLGGGIVAEFDSGIQANYAHCHNNWLCGISSLSSSSVRAFNTNVHNNQFGYMTFSNGSIEIYNSTVTNNAVYGYQSLSGGQVLGWEFCTQSGNDTYNGFPYRASFYQASDGYSATLNTGNLTIAGDGPQAGSGGDAYLDIRAKTGKDAIQRYIINGVEKARTQYFDVTGAWDLGGNGKTAFSFTPSTGRVNVGVGGPSTSATTGHLQIPACAGAPSSSVTDNQAGFVPIVYDWTDNRLYIYNGGWVFVQFGV